MTTNIDRLLTSLQAAGARLEAAERRPWLYCAGKIRACDWRNDLFGTRDIGGWFEVDRGWCDAGGQVNGSTWRFAGRGDGGNHPDWRYGGPFFIGCDHGCGHGPAQHGCAAVETSDLQVFNGYNPQQGGCLGTGDGGATRAQVINACLECIRNADVVFVWIDEGFASAYGTVAEIGYAAALGKPIYAARAQSAATLNLLEAWFPLSLVRPLGTHASAGAALAVLARVMGLEYLAAGGSIGLGDPSH